MAESLKEKLLKEGWVPAPEAGFGEQHDILKNGNQRNPIHR